MCVLTNNLSLSLLPKFAIELSQDEKLLALIFNYQQSPSTETYNTVQNYLIVKNKEFIERMKKVTKVKFLKFVGILDGDDKLLWSTAPLEIQPKTILLYQNNYDNSTAVTNHVKFFEDGLQIFGSSAGGPSSYPGGKSLFRFIFCSVTQAVLDGV